jgi:hypothetical protein
VAERRPPAAHARPHHVTEFEGIHAAANTIGQALNAQVPKVPLQLGVNGQGLGRNQQVNWDLAEFPPDSPAVRGYRTRCCFFHPSSAHCSVVHERAVPSMLEPPALDGPASCPWPRARV